MRILALLLAVAAALYAQEFRATLDGSVVDSSGAVVPKAQLTVTNVQTGVAIRAETSSA
ncbi:MAG: hypothetical protein JO022_07775 [Acidobacteriaceae bacterium]|nr:hypothetical protein [Acidobacteriaceae bacterium]